jgi:FixJ family two-component response regulator
MTEGIVFVVDDDDLVRRALRRLIKSDGFEVETFASARQFLNRGVPDSPACIVADIRMPGLSGLELQQELASAGSSVPIIFMTGHGTVPVSVRALKAGAEDFLEKPVDEQLLLDAIHRALDRFRRESEVAGRLADIQSRIASLTRREREVFELVVRGMLNKQIAAELGASEKTIKVHRGRVMRKMHADSLADLVRMAERARISGSMDGPEKNSD